MEGIFNTVIIIGIVVFCECVTTKETNVSIVITTTLTTAKDRGNVSPKPTSVIKGISVEPFKEISSTPYDLFNFNPERRSLNNHGPVGDVWEWDTWCQLQPKAGKCLGTGKKHGPMTLNYYYDAQLDTCKKFMFSGCDGNKNNFNTLVECERHCKVEDLTQNDPNQDDGNCNLKETMKKQEGSIYMTIKETQSSVYCGLQPNAGICMGLIERFYYDVAADRCKIFLYGGCGGNQNRFDNEELCYKRCR